jgi:Cytochrome c554 and c-prime
MRSLPTWTLPAFGLLLASCSDQVSPPTDTSGAVPPAFAPAADCGTCHPDQLAEWEASRHAFSGVDPLMLRMSEVAGPAVAPVCKQCHAPAQQRAERLGTGATVDLSHDGLNCDVCHSFSEVPPAGDVQFMRDVDPSGPKYGNLESPVPTPAHGSERRTWYGGSRACAPCHQFNLADGSGLENTFTEWEASVLAGMGVECQECHMPRYTGSAAKDAPVRDNLHRHTFVGPDYAYTDFRGVDLAAQKDAIRQLLQNAVHVDVEGMPATVPAGQSLDFGIRVTNDRTGHSIPSGVSFARQMWLAITVRDANTNVIYESGALTANGDLPSASEDPDLQGFFAVMYDATGAPTPFAWLAASIDETGLLRYLESRRVDYHVPVPAATPGPLTVQATLRFRSLPPAVVRELGLDDILPIEIFDMWTTSVPVGVDP